jgi:hypothetical protein
LQIKDLALVAASVTIGPGCFTPPKGHSTEKSR